jgi:hypothetical protein
MNSYYWNEIVCFVMSYHLEHDYVIVNGLAEKFLQICRIRMLERIKNFERIYLMCALKMIGYHMQEDETSEIWNTHWGDEKCIQKFS